MLEEGARLITENPASVNVSTFSVLHGGEGLESGVEGQVCSSSAVSRVLRKLNDWVRTACAPACARALRRMRDLIRNLPALRAA